METSQELAEIKSQVSGVQMAANALNVSNQAEMDLATKLLHDVKQAEKIVTAKKEEITRPLMKSLSNVRDLFKPIELNIADAIKTIKAKMLAWQIEEEEKVEKEKTRIAARVEKGTMRADTAAGKLEAVGDGPKSNVRTLKKVRVVDETIIPREYLTPNLTLITEDILRKGVTIAGCEIYEEKQIVAK